MLRLLRWLPPLFSVSGTSPSSMSGTSLSTGAGPVHRCPVSSMNRPPSSCSALRLAAQPAALGEVNSEPLVGSPHVHSGRCPAIALLWDNFTEG